MLSAASFLLILCGLSGTSATLGFCNDKDNSCSAWARDGECEGDNSEHVKTICPHSCGVCSLMCSDRDESCASWAKQGECTANPGDALRPWHATYWSRATLLCPTCLHLTLT